MISTELFPYQNFPYRLEFGEKKNITICYFECDEHLQKYLNRYKIDKRTAKIDYRDGKPTGTSKTDKNKVRQRTRKTSGGSTTTTPRNTKKLDSSGNTSRSTKSKK